MASAQNSGNTGSTQTTTGLGEVLAGCAACCDGVLSQAQAANASEDIIRRLEEARQICQSLANDLRSAATSGTAS